MSFLMNWVQSIPRNQMQYEILKYLFLGANSESCSILNLGVFQTNQVKVVFEYFRQ